MRSAAPVHSFAAGQHQVTLTVFDGNGLSATDTVRVHYRGTFQDGLRITEPMDAGIPLTRPSTT